jgi:hypothetical protein
MRPITAICDFTHAHKLQVAIKFVRIENRTIWRCEVKTTPVNVYEEEERQTEAAKQIAHAHHLLRNLSDTLRPLENYPELQEAITKLEKALSILTEPTGGML